MKIRILGAGAYGCHLAVALGEDNDVVIHEIADRIFAGATGNIPARLHAGQHYPRSGLTRAACRLHYAEFMEHYGDFTHGVATNIYAIAEYDSLVDFSTYRQILKPEIELITVERPAELGLQHVEGAILTGERHVLADKLREHFEGLLVGKIEFGREPGRVDDPDWDLTIDCTSCANDGLNVDRYEACLTLLLEGPADRAITIMDGPFGSLYPWDEERGLSSLTSAKWTPMVLLPTWGEARDFLDSVMASDLVAINSRNMLSQMAHYYPRIRDEYRVVDHRLSIRAMPRSAADARLVDVVRVGDRAIRIRAGKLDAIFHAEREVKRLLPKFER
jgi:hypothetical protein